MKSVLVTGGNGFIGRYVVEELLERGHGVVVFDTRLRQTVEGAKLILGDIRDATSTTEAIAHSDGIIHLAGVLGTQETIDNPRPAAETNILGGLNILEASVQYQVPCVNIAVGNFWENNTYSITKNSVERFADMMNRYRGGRIGVVRALNAYGPRQEPVAPWGSSKVRKIMPNFICRMLSHEPVEIYGDGLQIMDMIYVADVARVLVGALETLEAGTPIPTPLEAGSGRPTTVNDIAMAVGEAVFQTTGWLSPITHLPMRKGETPGAVVQGDPATLKVIGMDGSDFSTLEDGVARTVGYFKELLRV